MIKGVDPKPGCLNHCKGRHCRKVIVRERHGDFAQLRASAGCNVDGSGIAVNGDPGRSVDQNAAVLKVNFNRRVGAAVAIDAAIKQIDRETSRCWDTAT